MPCGPCIMLQICYCSCMALLHAEQESENMTNSVDNRTPRKLANMARKAATFDAHIAHFAQIAFAGKTLVAEQASMLHLTMIELIKDRAKFNKTAADGEKFQGLNKFQQAISRYIKGAAHIEDKRVSLKTTGDATGWNIALVSVASGDRKATAKKGGSSKVDKSAKTPAKSLEDTKLSLAQIIETLVDSHGYETVALAVEKYAPAKAA